jgi:hypothetical protein
MDSGLGNGTGLWDIRGRRTWHPVLVRGVEFDMARLRGIYRIRDVFWKGGKKD